ncbi:hypothetical protein ACFSQU_18015 [Massilia sp. GCM10020059]|uniref:Lipoprotein n=1 Tax=Massilia agrisoli TaxID=2892444 RepID=A0ABS8ITE1_9BURK|nr:hypothetical protein [Massilia agrisoli]MCC6071438.1 hypothetical protein [Massilia agrisoli]
MKTIISAALIAALLAGCNSPKDIVLGPEPLKQMAEQGDQFRKLTEDERMLLVGYLAAQSMRSAFTKETLPSTGKTVGEVLKEAGAWREKMKVEQAREAKREAEAAALQAKVAAEAAKISQQLATMVTIAVTGKTVLPKNYDVGRYSELLMVKYALENRSEKKIKQIKGDVIFTDATGDAVGQLGVEFDTNMEPGQTVKTDTGIGWKVNRYSRGDIEKIAERDFENMKGKFVISSIAFADGSVLRTQE